MAARLTDLQKKKIIADYVELGSYHAVARVHGVSVDTVKRVVLNDAEILQKMKQKKEENTADMLLYLESQKQIVCEIIGRGLEVLNDSKKLKEATPSQITTALGTLIDKFTAIGGGRHDEEEDGLSRSLRELGEELESDV